ncbi:MAG: glycosyltransferase, partial [Gemmatimonadetes bacterium]|nr:glycosyltransferase [Gemmatimonadota bacterium]
MKLVVFGLSVTSSWGNGHATTFRALLRAFRARGHEISFWEWDAPWYGGENRDLPDPEFCDLHLYESWEAASEEAVREAAEADAVIVGSYVKEGSRVLDALLERGTDVSFYDIDTPVTVAALRRGDCEYLRPDQVPAFGRYLSFTGGPFLHDVLEAELGVRLALPLYCAVDLSRYRAVEPDERYAADMAYMGTHAPDRQPGLQRLLLEPASRVTERSFVVAGPQYPVDLAWPANVRRFDHVGPADHPAFYSTADWQLNLTRADMRRAGWSPSVRLFEAAACGAAMMSDRWPGIDSFFEPEREIILPASAEEVVQALETTHPDDRRVIGARARERVRTEHSARARAEQLEGVLAGARRDRLAGARLETHRSGGRDGSLV